jgi:Flp pilus assembly protein TadG
MRRSFGLFRLSRRRRGLLRDQRGVAAIEFALISTVMFALLSGAVDVTQAITIQRDLNRFAVEVAQALASACKGGASCFGTAMETIRARQASIAPKLGAMQLGIANFDRTSTNIENIIGTMTYLPADMKTQALAMMANGDKGVAVLVTYTHQPIILGLADDWGFTTKNFTAKSIVLAARP